MDSRPEEAGKRASIDVAEPLLVTWEAARRNFRWYSSVDMANDASRWLQYPAIHGHGFSALVIAVPPGETAVLQASAGTVLLGDSGCVECCTGQGRYRLRQYDLLSLSNGAVYHCINTSEAFATIISTNSLAPAVDATAAAEQHMPWDSRDNFSWSLPLSDQWGHRRGSGPYISAAGVSGHLVCIPVAQRSPWHHIGRDMYFMPLNGYVDFHAAGRKWALGPKDFLVVPAGIPYQYCNSTFSDTFFFSMGGPNLSDGQAGYYVDDPGWPVRPNAETYQVERDARGDARIVTSALRSASR